MTVRILTGDCRDVLATLPAASVHCCVTSPPYFGLRDYGTGRWEGGDPECTHTPTGLSIDGKNIRAAAPNGKPSARDGAIMHGRCPCGAVRVDGQIGLEQTPEAFVAELVAVFREVRRVLRDDGTLWLNLGDSYANDGKWGGSSGGKHVAALHGSTGVGRGKVTTGLKPKDLIGIPWRVAFALQQPWEKVNIKDRIDRAWLAALVDGEGCMTIMQAQNGEKSATSFPPVLQVKMCDPECIEKANQITGFEQCLRQGSPSRGGMRDTYQWRITGRRAADIAAEIYPFLLIKRKQAMILWNHQMVRDSYETKRGQPMPAAAREKQIVCRRLIQKLNQKQPVDLPSWMAEPSITVEPGWYLRQDVIWSKPNPMPESVRDRCTKAHEYVFLLSKSARYYYDAQAIAEPAINAGRVVEYDGTQKNCEAAQDDRMRTRVAGDRTVGDTRNRRSVWEVATQAFSEAHFATFPPALIEPCILAGSPVGGTVLDPFGGAGTTGLVADRLQRDAILVELNPAYADMARRRIHGDAPLFAEVS